MTFNFCKNFPLYLFALIACFFSCQSSKVPGGKITIRNDILDKEFNSFVVDQVMTPKGLVAFSKSIGPDQQFVLPYKFISGMRFVRKYSDHSMVYQVSCNPNSNEILVIRLIDVHTNKLAGGCKLNKRGTMGKGGFIKWD